MFENVLFGMSPYLKTHFVVWHEPLFEYALNGIDIEAGFEVARWVGDAGARELIRSVSCPMSAAFVFFFVGIRQ